MFITHREAAEKLELSVETIRRKCAQGEIKAVKFGGKTWLMRESDLYSAGVPNWSTKKQENKKDAFITKVVNRLNDLAGTSFKAGSKKTIALINARRNEGYGLEDFNHVIQAKVTDWKNDTKMRRFLRPETLFGNKFEGYLNEGRNSALSDTVKAEMMAFAEDDSNAL